MINIFVDFDGTLIDAKPRLFFLFSKLVKESNLSFYEYWDLKKSGTSHQQILRNLLNYSDEAVNEFQTIWHNEIELKEWLTYDVPFPSSFQWLSHIKSEAEITLVTARQDEENVHWQLEKFGWENIFNKVLVTKAQKTKVDIISENVLVQHHDWLIGDTGKDIQTAQALNIQSAAVLTGFLKKEILIKYKPTQLLESICHFKIINKENE